MTAITGGVGGASTFSSASGGKVYGYNNISESAGLVVAQANPARQKIWFHNPGANDVIIAPAYVQNTLGTAPTQPSNNALTISNANKGGGILVYANGGTLEITGECQGAWQALAVTGAGPTNPLTVIDSNI